MRDMYSSPSSAQCRGTGMCSKDWTCFSRQPGWGTALSPCRTSDSPCTHCELCLVQEAVAHCFVYLWCFVCFASVEHYSEQCVDFNFFFFFFPEGFSSMASEGFASLDDLSLPTSLWGQCHLPVTDRKQTGTGSKWVTQSHVVFCHLWGDGNSASSNRSLRLSHYVCYSLCREWSTAKPTLKATLYTQPVMTRTRSTPLPRPTKLKLQLSMF